MTAHNGKAGTVFTGVSHGVCALIGAGVLALPSAVAAMGWAAGILCLLAFYGVSIGSSCVLASLYEVDGRKYGSYGAAVKALLGRCPRMQVLCDHMPLLTLTDVS